MAKWVCENCGFVSESEIRCPKCKAEVPQMVSIAKTDAFSSEIMENRADKLTDVLIGTFGYSNTYLLLDYARLLTEQKQLKHYGVKPESEEQDAGNTET